MFSGKRLEIADVINTAMGDIMNDYSIPVYVIAGFLESGKTSFLRFTLLQDYFLIDGKTLLILCEEGEEEYDADRLAKVNTVIEVLEGEEDLTTEKLSALELIHQPDRVVIEYNGMWLMTKLQTMTLPKDWGIEQLIVCADASTFQLYMQNMKSLFMDMVKYADMVVFNRANMDLPLANFRRSIKVNNPSTEVIFEGEDGEITDIFQGGMPFDVNAPKIEIAPEDYGIWFVDAQDSPETYAGKVLTFQAKVRKIPMLGNRVFVAGRMAMTCCSEDMTFLGFVCENKCGARINADQWIRLTADAKVEKRMEYRGEEGIVLYAKTIVPCDPLPDEMVYFN